MQSISISNIFSILGYISGFFLRPKIRISYRRGNAGSSGGPGNSLTLKWNYRLILDNLTNNHALELQFIDTGNIPSIELTETHIRGLSTITINQQLEKLVDRDTVIQSRHDLWGELIPLELRNIELCLKYRNEKGVPFYTLYKKEHESENNSYSMFRCSTGTDSH